MLVVTSNWGIGDGSLGAGPEGGRGRAFATAVQRAAARVGCRPDGSYRPIERVDVVFAGDTFDWLVSRRWGDAVRPWDCGPEAATLRRAVARASAARAWDTLHGLVKLVRSGLPVPAADARGRPRADRVVRVPVGLLLLAGDRDPWVERAGGRRLAARLGIAVGSGTGTGGVAIHHGHEAAAVDRSRPRVGPAGEVGPSLLDSVLVDLLVPFATAVIGLPAGRLVRRLAAAESPLDMPAVVAAALETPLAAAATRAALVDAWRWAVDTWWKRARRLRPRSIAPFDPLDALATWLEAIDPRPDRPPSPWLEAVTGPPDPRAFTLAAEVVVLGHPVARPPAPRVRCVALGPTPPGQGVAAGGATTVGGPGATRIVPGAAAFEPVRAVVLDGTSAASVVRALDGFDDPLRPLATVGAGHRAPREAA